MGGDVRTMEPGSEERQSCTLSITPWLCTHTHTYKHRNKLQLFTHNAHELEEWTQTQSTTGAHTHLL